MSDLCSGPLPFQASDIGRQLGESSPRLITQDTVDTFAELTGDSQWIHTDPIRAAGGPHGTTIVHGYLLLALLPALAREVLDLSKYGTTLNYGLDRVRFFRAVPVNAAVVDRVHLSSITRADRGFLVGFRHLIALAGGGNDVAEAHTLALLMHSETGRPR